MSVNFYMSAGSFLSEPHHNKMSGGGLLPPAYQNGNAAPSELKIARNSIVFDTFLKSGMRLHDSTPHNCFIPIVKH